VPFFIFGVSHGETPEVVTAGVHAGHPCHLTAAEFCRAKLLELFQPPSLAAGPRPLFQNPAGFDTASRTIQFHRKKTNSVKK
jgi:hypothetical protein